MLSALQTIIVRRHGPHIAEIAFNVPARKNAMSALMFAELYDVFANRLAEDADLRAVVLTGEGSAFTAGLDLREFAPMLGLAPPASASSATAIASAEKVVKRDQARDGLRLRNEILRLQRCVSSIEQQPLPVISAIHGPCIGAGVDIITACDVRFAAQNALFSVREVRVGLAADIGTLQRLPRVIGNQSAVRELCLTGRDFTAEEALSLGLISKIFSDKEACRTAALDTASNIAALSPIAVQGTKHNLNYARDHSVDDSLAYQAIMNATALRTHDIALSVQMSAPKQAVQAVAAGEKASSSSSAPSPATAESQDATSSHQRSVFRNL